MILVTCAVAAGWLLGFTVSRIVLGKEPTYE